MATISMALFCACWLSSVAPVFFFFNSHQLFTDLKSGKFLKEPTDSSLTTSSFCQETLDRAFSEGSSFNAVS
jgi:hypothetical protein